MAYVKRLLLLLAMGSVSVVLAGCYGVPAKHRMNTPFRAPMAADREPVEGLKTAGSPKADTQQQSR
jgi:hypothetical protein